MCLPLIVTFLSAVPFIVAQGREITCACSTTHCQEQGARTCNTTGLCFSQYLDRRDGSDPLVRGCVESRTPLLCENKRPAVALHRGWPVLVCCETSMCNARVTPTLPPSDTTTTGPTTTDARQPAPDVPPSSTTNFRDSLYLTVLLVGICAVICIVVVAIFLTRRHSAMAYDPEFGRVGPNGYVKGCPADPPTCCPPVAKGLDINRFALDT